MPRNRALKGDAKTMHQAWRDLEPVGEALKHIGAPDALQAALQRIRKKLFVPGKHNEVNVTEANAASFAEKYQKQLQIDVAKLLDSGLPAKEEVSFTQGTQHDPFD